MSQEETNEEPNIEFRFGDAAISLKNDKEEWKRIKRAIDIWFEESPK